MESRITFNELRKIKDSLPDGSIKELRKSLIFRKKPSGIILGRKLHRRCNSGNSHGTGTRRRHCSVG